VRSRDAAAGDGELVAAVAIPTGPTADTASAAALIHLLSETEHRVTQALCEVLAAERTTVAQWHVLCLLADDASHPMTEVAEYTLLTPATATRVIDTMVCDGLVHRTIDDADRRRVLVRISAAGRARLRRLSSRVHRSRAAILAGADLERLRRALERTAPAR
jgi:DNA-binding MarR family transcriptional regulator